MWARKKSYEWGNKTKVKIKEAGIDASLANLILNKNNKIVKIRHHLHSPRKGEHSFLGHLLLMVSALVTLSGEWVLVWIKKSPIKAESFSI